MARRTAPDAAISAHRIRRVLSGFGLASRVAARHTGSGIARCRIDPRRGAGLGPPAPPRYHNRHVPGVYTSYPFCAQKCTYCNFASGVFPRDLEPPYLDALARKIRDHAWHWTPDTVYLGGGTPSHLAPD